jgi:hypothetical protein
MFPTAGSSVLLFRTTYANTLRDAEDNVTQNVKIRQAEDICSVIFNQSPAYVPSLQNARIELDTPILASMIGSLWLICILPARIVNPR